MRKIKGLFKELKYDLPAGLVVYLVALPLCLGVAHASTGRPDLLFSGIIAGLVGGIIVGALSGSALGVSGPAAGLVVIILGALQTLGSYEAFLLAVVIAGAIQLLAGFLKAGVIGYFFPSSVIKGMLAAIGITLILKEIPHAFGFDKDFMGDEAFDESDGNNTFTQIYNAVRYSNTGAIIISLVSIGVLLLFERPFMKKIQLFRFVPGALFVVIIGILLNGWLGQINPEWLMQDKHLVQLPVAENFNQFISFFTAPDFSKLQDPAIYKVALTLAIVASLETLLSVEATDKLDPFKRNTNANRELKAQGVGNMVSGLIGGLPVTQVIVRSSANVSAGGKTKMATITHGIILLLSAILIPRYLNYIPLASLAAILLLVGYKLAKVSLFKGMYKLGWEQFIPFVVTVSAILLTDLLKGIAIGMAVGIFYILRKNFRLSYHFNKEVIDNRETIHLQLSEEVTFLNKGGISNILDQLPHGCKVIIDGSKSIDIDHDVLEIIHDFKDYAAPLKYITLELIDIPYVGKVGSH
ncbi:MAG: SulP family inorganic anion transporter [Bacteroidota bacterium]